MGRPERRRGRATVPVPGPQRGDALIVRDPATGLPLRRATDLPSGAAVVFSSESAVDAACLLGAALEALLAGLPCAQEQAREALALTAFMRGVR